MITQTHNRGGLKECRPPDDAIIEEPLNCSFEVCERLSEEARTFLALCSEV